jgi:hypothetical protein
MNHLKICSSRSVAYGTAGLGRGFDGSLLGNGIPCRSYTMGKSERATFKGS